MDKKELISYLKDVYELESQLYTLNKLKDEYENAYELLEETKNGPLYTLEYFDGTRTEESNQGQVVATYIINGQRLPLPLTADAESEDLRMNFITISNMRETWKTPEYYEMSSQFQKGKKECESQKKTRVGATVLLAIIAYLVFSAFMNSQTVGIVGAIIVGVISYVLLVRNYNDLKYLNDTDEYDYRKRMFNKDASAKIAFCQERINIIVSEYKNTILPSISTTEDLLKQLYSKNVIHPKYQNLIAVGQIYEYLETGRCDELEGPDGAYNLFENELSQKIIQLQLDLIITQLETLNRTMYYVATAISQSNILLGNISKQLGQISTSLSLIESNTALSAYNTQCSAFNTELMRRYH